MSKPNKANRERYHKKHPERALKTKRRKGFAK